MKNPPRRFDIFEPVRKVPKQLQDAALVLGSPRSPRAAIHDAADLLDAEGMARAPGCSSGEIRMSAGRLAAVICERQGMEAAEVARLRTVQRMAVVQRMRAADGSGGGGSGGPGSSGRPVKQRGQGRR